jgi:hypothetical protein
MTSELRLIGSFRSAENYSADRCKPLLHPSALEEAGIRRVLLDVRGLALFLGVFRVVLLVRCISRRVGILGNTLVAAIGGWDRRHATGHVIVPCER